MAYTDILDRAIKFAIDAHKDAVRKGGKVPYIVHPLEAVSVVATMTDDMELMAAAVLHDVLEDTETSAETLLKEFGERVTRIVINESDEKTDELHQAESWKTRKQKAINRLKNADTDTKIVALGDKLSNMRAIYNDYTKLGDKVWDKFHVKERSEHEWHYRGLADALKELSYENAYKEFIRLLDKVFN